MQTKKEEIDEFRKRKKIMTADTIWRMKSEFELQKGAKRREKLYDLFVGGRDAVRQRERNSSFSWFK